MLSNVILDISIGVMALGKIYEYKRLDKHFPEGVGLIQTVIRRLTPMQIPLLNLLCGHLE